MNWDVGMRLNSLKKGPLTKEDLKAYAPASGDHNPIHLEDSFAQQAGFPSVIVHGMLSMAFLGDLICFNFPEEKWRVKNFQSRFRKVTFPGEELTCYGEIKANDNKQLNLILWIENPKGEMTVEGKAVVEPIS